MIGMCSLKDAVCGVAGPVSYSNPPQQIKRKAEVRPASPVESELNRLTDELARLEGLINSLANRLEPVTICKAAGQASTGNPPYEGCQIGARINSAATNVRDIADKLDSLCSALQV